MTIRRRITKGYVIVLGIALTGVVGGLFVGNAYQHDAQKLRRETTTERKLLNQLRVDILRNRPANQLSLYLSDPVGLAEAGKSFLRRLEQVETTVAEHHKIHAEVDLHEHGYEAGEQFHFEDENMASMHRIHNSLVQFERDLAAFKDELVIFLAWMAENPPETAAELAIAETRLLELARSAEFSTFVGYVDDIEPFLSEISRRESLAEANLLRAEELRNKIIIGSLCVSFLLAGILATITSRAIGQPISEIANFAQRVTETESFDQSIDLQGDEEIEILSSSLNQLIHQVYLLLNTINKKNTELAEAFAQLQAQQLQMVQAEKMSSLGELVAGVAHEINNPVNFIHGNVHHSRTYLKDLLGLMALYQRHYPDPDPEILAEAEVIDLDFLLEDFPKMLDSMGLGTKRIRDIVLSLRTFSRVDAAEVNHVDIHAGIESTLVILNHRLKEKSYRPAIKVIKHYGELPLVEGFPGQLNQVFMNILSNAIDALEETNGGRTVADIQSNPNQIEITTAVIGGDRIEIRIKDNGKGMSAAVKDKIFTLFFTTKDFGKGSGMGMAISHQIITENHHGEIAINSALGLGAEFVLTLPISQGRRSASQDIGLNELAIAS